MVQRRGQRPIESESSSDEEDAFSSLGKKAKRAKIESTSSGNVDNNLQPNAKDRIASRGSAPMQALPVSITSSMKRHHKTNDDRKARMDALLQELEAGQPDKSSEPYRFVPDKKGSFVDPSEEHLTTNIFVGNLCSSITEEDLTKLFLKFGPLYSVKIMWPHNPSERRSRHKGFVCFINRKDAEDAMDAYDDSDPFNVGRRLILRWGKSVMHDPDSQVALGDSVTPGMPQDDPNEIQVHQDSNESCTSHRSSDTKTRKEFMTGRQIERARKERRRGKRRSHELDYGFQLSSKDREQFDLLVRKKLSISRKSICLAMAFCFEKSGAAKEIADLLKETLLEDGSHVTIDMRIARLYLLSDILFNSQQPGIRNAFMYRDALEKMAPDIFTSLGRHGGNSIGRMTMNKLRTAVSAVLGAWTEWSVYNRIFLDELEARFEGKEIKTESLNSETASVESDTVEPEPEANEIEVVINEARGDWSDVKEEHENQEGNKKRGSKKRRAQRDPSVPPEVAKDKVNALCQDVSLQDGNEEAKDDNNESLVPVVEEISNVEVDLDGESLEEGDLDGEPLDDDDQIDGSPIGEVNLVQSASNVEGDQEDEDIDGEALDDVDEDLDGEEWEE